MYKDKRTFKTKTLTKDRALTHTERKVEVLRNRPRPLGLGVPTGPRTPLVGRPRPPMGPRRIGPRMGPVRGGPRIGPVRGGPRMGPRGPRIGPRGRGPQMGPGGSPGPRMGRRPVGSRWPRMGR